MRLAPQTSWLVVVTGGAAPDDLAGRLRSWLGPDVALLLIRADGAQPTSVSRVQGARLLGLKTLEELPRALAAAVQGVAA
jgi:hypothetical protein